MPGCPFIHPLQHDFGGSRNKGICGDLSCHEGVQKGKCREVQNYTHTRSHEGVQKRKWREVQNYTHTGSHEGVQKRKCREVHILEVKVILRTRYS